MAKLHNALTGTDLHNPKGIGVEGTSTVLVVSQSIYAVSASASIVPHAANEYDLGSATRPWKELFVSTSSIKFVTSDGDVISTMKATKAGVTFTSGSTGVSADVSGSTISGSALHIEGSGKITGDLTLGGSINIGDADTDDITLGGEIKSNIVPDADATYDLGSSTKGWNDLHLGSGGVVNFDGGDVTFTHSSNDVAVAGGTLTVDGGVKVDNITIDGTEIDLSSGDLTIDVAGDVIIDADGGDFKIDDAGVSLFDVSSTKISGSETATGSFATIETVSNVSSSQSATGSFGRLQTHQANASFGGKILTLAGNLTTSTGAGTIDFAADKTLTLNEDLTVSDGQNVVLAAAGQANTFTMNESFTIGDGNSGTLTYSGASKTLTVEDNSTINQDVTSDASVTFGDVTADGGVSIDNITIDGTEIDLSSGDLTIDVAGDLIVDVDGGDFKVDDAGVHLFDVTATKVSGSATSTGSFARIETDSTISGSQASTGSFGRLQTHQANASLGGKIVTLAGNLTTQNNNLTINAADAARTLTLTEDFTIGGGNSGTLTYSGASKTLTVADTTTLSGGGNTLTLAGDLTTQNNNVIINAADAERTLTLTEDFTIGGGHAGTLTYSAGSKTLTVENDSAVNQDLTSDANPTFAGGTLGNIQVGVTGDQEIDTSSGNLILDSAGGTVQVTDTLDVDGNQTISGNLTADHGSNNFQITSTNASVLVEGITFTGNDVFIPGNLTVSGSQTIISSSALDVVDINITVGSGSESSAALDGAGLTFGKADIARLQYDHSLTAMSSSVDFYAPNVSASMAGTGSFGRLETHQANADLGGKIVTLAGNLTTQNNNLTINAVDAARTLTLTEDFTIGGGHAGTLTFSAGSKTLTVENTSAVNQDLTSDASVTFGDVTADGGVSIDNITIDGTEIDLSSGDLTIDVAGDVEINADGGDVIFKDDAADLATINATKVSGSQASTGSFGRIETHTAEVKIGGNIVTLGGALTTQNNNVTINAAGAARTLTLNESLTVGDGNDGTVTFSASSKTLTVEDNATVSQDMTSDANPTFAGVTAGNVKVGVTADGEIDTSSGNLTIDSAGGTVTIDDDCTISGTLTESSSEIYKENISQLQNGLDKVLMMRGVEFDYKSDKSHSIGVVAEEISKVEPYLLSDDKKSVSYTRIVPLLIEAVKSLNNKVEEQNKLIESLKN
jgi:hypothetical protein